MVLSSDWTISIETGLNNKAWAEMMKTATSNFWFLGIEKHNLHNEKLSRVCKP